MSLLVRVIKDAVENVSISAWEKYSTFVKILLLTFRPKPSAILEAKKPVIILHTIPRTAIPSMMTGVKNVIHILIRDSPVDDIRQIGGKPQRGSPSGRHTDQHA